MNPLDDILAHRIIVVTGKGGTGKTTMAALLGQAAARRGLRTVVVEIGGARRIPEIFDRESLGYALQQLEPGLQTLSLSAEEAAEDFIILHVKVKAIYQLVFRNRVMGPFMDAVPGLPDVVQLGKVFEMYRSTDDAGVALHDRLIVDAPSTGHGLSMLEAPQTMMDMTRGGPFHANARLVRDVFYDPNLTALVVCTLAEPLPVNETLELCERLAAYRPQVRACVVNRMRQMPDIDLADWDRVRTRLAPSDRLAWADRWMGILRRQEDALSRLKEHIPCPVVTLPEIPTTRIGPEQLKTLAAQLSQAVGPRP